METYASIIVPYSLAHTPLMPRAVASALAQTVPACVLAIRDDLARGPGALRNYGASIAPTPFVTFLDADDWIEPAFIEDCLEAWQPGRYVYTDWYQSGNLQLAPLIHQLWRNDIKSIRRMDKDWEYPLGTYNCITTLINRDDFVASGGFDENLSGMEDSDFYLNLASRKVCPLLVSKALFHYDKHEGIQSRSITFVESAQRDIVSNMIGQRYGGYTMAEQCGTCGGGGNVSIDIPPLGEPQEGFVLAIAKWGGNHRKRGVQSGILYDKAGNGRLMYVDARDVDGVSWERATPAQSEEFKRLSGAREVGLWLLNASDAPYNPFAAGDAPVSTERGDFAEQLKLAKLD
jgi:hypothetical protein